jgi:endonuclease YncB( thermonuclease family)
MARTLFLAVAATALAAAAPAEARRPARGARGRHDAMLVLDGAAVPVRWTDGDTFRVLGGARAGRLARLEGVNALETYGPVHRFGTAGPAALLAVARAAAGVAAAAGGRCEALAHEDRYGRLLVRCPEAAAALVRSGHAMAYGVDGPPPPELVALQREAQRARAGIWAGGVPPRIPTSVHSAAEAGVEGVGGGGAYDRLCDTRTGLTVLAPHGRAYRTCEEVCVGDGADRACMTYVPYERRYRRRPFCLR